MGGLLTRFNNNRLLSNFAIGSTHLLSFQAAKFDAKFYDANTHFGHCTSSTSLGYPRLASKYHLVDLMDEATEQELFYRDASDRFSER